MKDNPPIWRSNQHFLIVVGVFLLLFGAYGIIESFMSGHIRAPLGRDTVTGKLALALILIYIFVGGYLVSSALGYLNRWRR